MKIPIIKILLFINFLKSNQEDERKNSSNLEVKESACVITDGKVGELTSHQYSHEIFSVIFPIIIVFFGKYLVGYYDLKDISIRFDPNRDKREFSGFEGYYGVFLAVSWFIISGIMNLLLNKKKKQIYKKTISFSISILLVVTTVLIIVLNAVKEQEVEDVETIEYLTLGLKIASEFLICFISMSFSYKMEFLSQGDNDLLKATLKYFFLASIMGLILAILNNEKKIRDLYYIYWMIGVLFALWCNSTFHSYKNRKALKDTNIKEKKEVEKKKLNASSTLRILFLLLAHISIPLFSNIKALEQGLICTLLRIDANEDTAIPILLMLFYFFVGVISNIVLGPLVHMVICKAGFCHYITEKKNLILIEHFKMIVSYTFMSFGLILRCISENSLPMNICVVVFISVGYNMTADTYRYSIYSYYCVGTSIEDPYRFLLSAFGIAENLYVYYSILSRKLPVLGINIANLMLMIFGILITVYQVFSDYEKVSKNEKSEKDLINRETKEFFIITYRIVVSYFDFRAVNLFRKKQKDNL